MSKGKGGSKAAGGGGGASPKGAGGSMKEIVDKLGLVNSEYLRSGMRDLKFARSHYAGMSAKEADRLARTSAYPVRVSMYPEKGGKTSVHLSDGRHRMTAAREAGAKYIRATVTRYGPRGGVKGTWTGPVRIG